MYNWFMGHIKITSHGAKVVCKLYVMEVKKTTKHQLLSFGHYYYDFCLKQATGTKSCFWQSCIKEGLACQTKLLYLF